MVIEGKSGGQENERASSSGDRVLKHLMEFHSVVGEVFLSIYLCHFVTSSGLARQIKIGKITIQAQPNK